MGRDRVVVHQALAGDDMAMLADVPRRVAMQVLGTPPAEKVYSAPRRFDLATIFVVTAAYSLGLGMLRGFGTPPIVVLYIAVFITAVGVGQPILFGGTKPRLASVLMGIGAFFVGTLSLPLVGRLHIGDFSEQIAFALLFSAPFGGGLGYVAGALVGGVFLVADKVRQRFTRGQGDDTAVEVVALKEPADQHS